MNLASKMGKWTLSATADTTDTDSAVLYVGGQDKIQVLGYLFSDSFSCRCMKYSAFPSEIPCLAVI